MTMREKILAARAEHCAAKTDGKLSMREAEFFEAGYLAAVRESKDEVTRLREALIYYANPNEYIYDLIGRRCPIENDGGYIARQALGE